MRLVVERRSPLPVSDSLLFIGDPSFPPSEDRDEQQKSRRSRGDPCPTPSRVKFLALLGFLGLLPLPVVIQQRLDIVLDVVDADIAGLL
jgi:hypothetical protein